MVKTTTAPNIKRNEEIKMKRYVVILDRKVPVRDLLKIVAQAALIAIGLFGAAHVFFALLVSIGTL